MDFNDGREPLLRALAGRRAHILAAVDGLTDAQLRTPVLPSGWSALGLVRHLTFGVERYWFETVVAGGSLDYWPASDGPDDATADWRVSVDELASEVLRQYRDAIEATDSILARTGMDDPLRSPDPHAGYRDVRAVVVHAIVDTATHAGHLDAVRELLDGRQHLVL